MRDRKPVGMPRVQQLTYHSKAVTQTPPIICRGDIEQHTLGDHYSRSRLRDAVLFFIENEKTWGACRALQSHNLLDSLARTRPSTFFGGDSVDHIKEHHTMVMPLYRAEAWTTVQIMYMIHKTT